MALSGSKTVGAGAYWDLVLEWSATQSITNNTSTITAKLYWQGHSSYGAVYSSATKDVSITIDGSRSSTTATAGLSAGQKKLLHTYTKTVSHSSTGAKSVAISGVFDMEVTLGGTYYGSKTASGTWTLDTIARKSSFTMGDIYLYYNESTTISIKRASSAFTHSITYSIGSIARTVASKTTSTSISFTPNVNDLTAFPNSTYGTATMKVETFNGTTSLGYVTKTFQIHATADAARPTISSFTVTDNNSAIRTLMGTGNYVQGHSDFTFAVGSAGKYGATIKSRSITFNGQSSSSSSWNYGQIAKSGNITATAKVTDSRGYVTTDTLVVSIIPYSAPRISSFTATRLTATPETVRTNYSVSISDLMVGLTPKNTVTVQLQYKLRTSTVWTTVGTYTTASRLTDVPGLLESNSYDLRILVSDKLTSGLLSTASVSTAAVLMDMAQYGIGVGKMWERGALDVRGNAYFKGDIHFETANGGLNFLNTDGTTYNALHMKDNYLYLNNNDVLKFVEGDPNGHGIALGAGGLTVVGGGESYRNFIDGHIAAGNTGGTEQMWITSDYDISFQSGMQSGYGTGYTWMLDRNGTLVPPHANSVQINQYGNIGIPSSVSSATWNVIDANNKTKLRIPMGANNSIRQSILLGSNFEFYSDLGPSGDTESQSALVFRNYSSTNKEFILVSDATNGFYFNADQAIPDPGNIGTGNGQLYAGKFNVVSDENLKEEIVEFNQTALEKIKGSKTYKYKHVKSDERKAKLEANGIVEKPSLGLLAQEAPSEITTDSGLGIDLYAMNTLMWKAIQELSAQVEYLQKKSKNK